MSDELLTNNPPEPQAGRDLEGQRILDRIRNRVFGVQTGPTRVGRWQILHKLGKGAMGTVYAAYDPELDRQVAIKVLHGMPPEAEHVRRIRLRREAQAMARVKHPNLVQVYDVCADAAQPYVVMELIDGETFRTWQERPERTWREVTEAYLGAARGLAELHRVELFHRDFKPDNALIDRAGRARVVDFGLVATSDVQEGLEPMGTRLTHEGALVGTIAYMSPEQLMGSRGDAASDQFSLCRSLYEALYRARPFVGDDPESLLTEMRAGPPPLRPNPRRVPRWLGAQVRRGLAFDARHRFESMNALAAKLDTALHRHPGRKLLATGAGLALGITSATWLLPDQPCDGLATELSGAWDSRQEPAIRDAFLAQALPEAPQQWAALSAAMQANRGLWLRLREETCSERKADRVPAWVIERDGCLEQARLIMQGLARGYQTPTSRDVIEARAAAAGLATQIHDCARIGPLYKGPLPPDLTPLVEGSLASAASEQLAGRLESAETAARRALEAAEHTGVQAAIAEALHRLGRILGHERKSDPALVALDRAASEAVRAGHDRIYVDARLFAAKLRILDYGHVDRAERDSTDAEDFIVRLDAQGFDTLRQTAELHEVRGFTAHERGDDNRAFDHFLQALRAHRLRRGADAGPIARIDCRMSDARSGLEVSEDPALDELRMLNNLAFVLAESPTPSDRDCTEQLYRTALAGSEASLGPLHPITLDIRNDLANWLRDAERDEEAVDVLRPSLDAARVQYGSENSAIADHLLLLATIALDHKDFASAKTWITRATELFAQNCSRQGCPRNYGNALIVQAEHARMTGDLEAALKLYQSALEPLSAASADEQLADCTLFIAETLLALRRPTEAGAWLDQALPLFKAQGRMDDAALSKFHKQLELHTSPPKRDHAPRSHRPEPRVP